MKLNKVRTKKERKERKLTIDITVPGEQDPHWLPSFSAKAVC
jgi:hypothetical protein